MDVSEWIAVVSIVTALVSFAFQQFLSREVSKSNARARHYERTQTLLLRALDDPELLQAIGSVGEEDQKRRRYWQLWLNHIEMIYRQRNFFDRVHWQGTVIDVQGFMTIPDLKSHWHRYKGSYAADFQKFVDHEIMNEEAEPPRAEAPPSLAHSTTT